MKTMEKRISRLEDRALDDEPPVRVNVIINQLDGTAVLDGVTYPSEADAVAAVPPGEDHIVGQVVDARRKHSTETQESQS